MKISIQAIKQASKAINSRKGKYLPIYESVAKGKNVTLAEVSDEKLELKTHYKVISKTDDFVNFLQIVAIGEDLIKNGVADSKVKSISFLLDKIEGGTEDIAEQLYDIIARYRNGDFSATWLALYKRFIHTNSCGPGRKYEQYGDLFEVILENGKIIAKSLVVIEKSDINV